MMMIVTVATVRADFAEASVKRDLLPMTRDALCASSVAPKHLHQLMRFLAPVQSARRIMFFFAKANSRSYFQRYPSVDVVYRPTGIRPSADDWDAMLPLTQYGYNYNSTSIRPRLNMLFNICTQIDNELFMASYQKFASKDARFLWRFYCDIFCSFVMGKVVLRIVCTS